MKRFELIDFLKGYSIFTIMIFHYLQYISLPEPFNTMISFGGTGVHLYVLLSGFGLYYSFLLKPISYSAFIKKRFIKVYVPYIVVILISAIVSVSVAVYDNSWYALCGHLFLFKMFDESIMGSYGYPLWFISMIIQFYLLFHLIAWLRFKLTEISFIIVGILLSLSWASLVFALGKADQRIWNSFFLQYFWEFSLGMILAERVLKKQKIIGRDIKQGFLLLVAIINCAVYALLAIKGGSAGRLFNDYFALTGYALLAVWIFNLKSKYLNQLFIYIGKVSFSVYLLHILLLLLIAEMVGEINPIYHVLLALALIIPIAALYQKGIDLFFTRVKL